MPSRYYLKQDCTFALRIEYIGISITCDLNLYNIEIIDYEFN